MSKTKPPVLRCAIYTRKSSEEGLEQAFNSLDAQREACSAYITSQRHEGWQELSANYDDGGFSGGNVERPALTSLLADIRSQEVDIIVVYKVDRLSRSLADFARLVELFDEHNVSFVSVTQQFNTSTSMGRLTLNVLLSFAQFEREVTGERIRDKIAASKRKGMWMGGLVPLGYDRVEKQLVVNEPEAALVRRIYQRYLDLGCVRALKAELDAEGQVSKQRSKEARSPGGKPFGRGALYTILKNPVYVGKVSHKGELHEGCHAAILEPKLWEAVQEQLQRNVRKHRSRANAKHPSLLAGLILDDKGNVMSPTYTRQGNRHYTYYVSQAVLQFNEKEVGSVSRISGTTLEEIVTEALFKFCADGPKLLRRLTDTSDSAHIKGQLAKAGAKLADKWDVLEIYQRIEMIKRVLEKVIVGRARVTLKLSSAGLRASLLKEPTTAVEDAGVNPEKPIQLDIPVQLKRCGIESKLVIPAGPEPTMHPRTVRAAQEALLKALQWHQELAKGETKSFQDIARREGLPSTYVRRIYRLMSLSPKAMQVIASGQIPEPLALEALRAGFPLDWGEQEALFRI